MKTPYIVAEISANHLGSLLRARALIEAAAESGADAIKLQTYKPDTMTLKIDEFAISKDHKLWGGISLYELYEQAMTPWEWHAELFDLAHELGLDAFSSPFDRSAVDFLEKLDCPIYKIASMETGDVDLIEYVASKNKPLIISTGASTMEEIEKALKATEKSNSKVTLLVCTSSYPAEPVDAHINRILTLREKFRVDIGISDHTIGIGVSVAAVALGATVVEKHFTLARSDGGHDSAFSLEPKEFASLVSECGNAALSLGNPEWSIADSEGESRKLRRSLFIARDVKQGEVATRDNVKALRPNSGGAIENLPRILGRKFIQDYSAGTAANMECMEQELN